MCPNYSANAPRVANMIFPLPRRCWPHSRGLRQTVLGAAMVAVLEPRCLSREEGPRGTMLEGCHFVEKVAEVRKCTRRIDLTLPIPTLTLSQSDPFNHWRAGCPFV